MEEYCKQDKDWTGNSKSTFVTLGASNHVEHDRAENDFYSTDPNALRIFLNKIEKDGDIKLAEHIWECACGNGALSKVLIANNYKVCSTDLIDRGFGLSGVDFLETQHLPDETECYDWDILTNPPYKCFDIATECYTKRGWLKYNELNKDDEVLSVNPNTLEVEWSKINEIIIRDLDISEKMYNFKKADLDIMVTNGHRMFAYYKKNLATKNSDLIHSENIRSKHYIPRTGYKWFGEKIDEFILPAIDGFEHAQPVYKKEIHINMIDWLKFFGLWLADGYTRHTINSNGNQRKTVGIKQGIVTSAYVREVLNKLPFQYKEYRDVHRKKECINFEIHNEQLWNYLQNFGKSMDKYIPDSIKKLDSKLLQILIDAYFFGDGSVAAHDGRVYRTSSKKLIEDLQEILFKLGYLSHIIVSKYRTINGTRLLYTINYSPNTIYSKYYYPSNKNDSCVCEYDDKVWFLNLAKNGCFLLRRNGKEFVCGNCAKEFVEKALDLVEKGRYVVMFLKIQFLEGKERRKLFEKYPPKFIYVNSERQICYLNGDDSKKMSSATCYCWFVWEKGFNGEPIIRWI